MSEEFYSLLGKIGTTFLAIGVVGLIILFCIKKHEETKTLWITRVAADPFQPEYELGLHPNGNVVWRKTK